MNALPAKIHVIQMQHARIMLVHTHVHVLMDLLAMVTTAQVEWRILEEF